MDHPSNGGDGLQATTNHDELTDAVRVEVLGSLDQASRPSLVHMIQTLRSRGVQSHVSVDLSRASRVESTALAGLRADLNTMEGAPVTLGGGVSLLLTGTEAEQPDGNTVVPIREITEVLEAEYAAAFEAPSPSDAEPLPVPLAIRPLADYSDDELYAASDEVFSLLDDPEAVGGPDLLGRYNDIGEEILRRTPLTELLNPAEERQAAS
jgi:ABC-type transporter Mla MlaB component